jgi:DNA-binding transcriptional ArsR family regulator
MSPTTRSLRPAEREVELVCRALSDATRRAILDALGKAPRTTGELAQLFPTTRFAVMKHLAVLETAGLVVVTRRGRERWNHFNAVPLQRLVDRWIHPLAQRGARSLLALQRHLEEQE